MNAIKKINISLLVVGFSAFSMQTCLGADKPGAPKAPAAKTVDLSKPVAETYVGYLVDRSCCAMMQQQGKDPVPALKAHFKSCSLEPSCCEAGYAVYSKGRFYDLDARGNALAKKYFEATKINAGHIVKVTGLFRRNELKTESLVQSN